MCPGANMVRCRIVHTWSHNSSTPCTTFWPSFPGLRSWCAIHAIQVSNRSIDNLLCAWISTNSVFWDVYGMNSMLRPKECSLNRHGSCPGCFDDWPRLHWTHGLLLSWPNKCFWGCCKLENFCCSNFFGWSAGLWKLKTPIFFQKRTYKAMR